MTIGKGLNKTQLPQGFLASGLNCGVRKYRPDIGLVSSEVDCTTVAVFTQNSFLGEHIKYDQKLLPSQSIRAIITNSGQANTGVGAIGAEDNFAMANTTAKALGVDHSQVLTASTGVIGQRMEIEKIQSGIADLVADQTDCADNFATAILTTDLVPKCVTTEIELSQGKVRVTGVAKGSGMIHPNMATMLGYILTDAKLDCDQAQGLLKSSVDKTFNMISVDGETSTNDTVFLMANGMSGVAMITDEDQVALKSCITEISEFLAKAIAKDGEGATKLIEIQLAGADEARNASDWARSLVVSPLVKTAIHGNDPNWGRLLARLGQEGVPTKALEQMSLKIQDVDVVTAGNIQEFNHDELVQKMKTETITIKIDLKMGDHNAVAWGCDLSKKYVQINAEYTS